MTTYVAALLVLLPASPALSGTWLLEGLMVSEPISSRDMTGFVPSLGKRVSIRVEIGETTTMTTGDPIGTVGGYTYYLDAIERLELSFPDVGVTYAMNAHLWVNSEPGSSIPGGSGNWVEFDCQLPLPGSDPFSGADIQSLIVVVHYTLGTIPDTSIPVSQPPDSAMTFVSVHAVGQPPIRPFAFSRLSLWPTQTATSS